MTEATDELIEQLLYDPPQDPDELRQRLGETDIEAVRHAMVERIEEGELDDIDAIVAGNVFDVMGFGEQRDRLIDIVSSPMPDEAAEHRRAREAAFVALSMNTDFAPDDPDTTFGLSDGQYTDLAASVYASLFEFTEMNIDLVYDFGGMLLHEPVDVRPELFEALEEYRTDTNVDAGVLYRPLLEDETYRELWPLLIDAVVAEGVPRDAQWLERAADRVDDEHAQQFRKAAMELRTKGLKDHHLPEGFALIGTPDGLGSYPIFVFTERREGVYAGHNLTIDHRTHEIRDGFFIPNLVDEEIDELIEDIEQTEATKLTRVAVEVGIHLAQEQIAGSDHDYDDLPPEARVAIYRLERLPTGGAELPHVPAADQLDAGFVRGRLDDEICYESWFFDQSTLADADALPLPEKEDDPSEWKAEAAASLAEKEGLVEDVADNLDMMALWYVLDGQEEAGEQFAALAAKTREDFADSPALDFLLDETLAAIREMEDYAGAFLFEMLGDASERAELHDDHLEGRGFDEETEEKYLDYMELTLHTLAEIKAELPEHLQPTYGQMQQAAGPIGLVMANFFSQEPIGPPDELAQTVSSELIDVGVDARAGTYLVPELLTNGRLLAMFRG